MQSKYLEERFSLSIRILVTSSYILLTVSSMKQTRTKVNSSVALLYVCRFVRTESGVESNNRIEYLDFCGRLWCHLHYLYEYCSYRFEVKAVEREKLLSLGWYEDSDLDGSDSRHNHVSWLDFIHYIRFVPVFLFERHRDRNELLEGFIDAGGITSVWKKVSDGNRFQFSE